MARVKGMRCSVTVTPATTVLLGVPGNTKSSGTLGRLRKDSGSCGITDRTDDVRVCRLEPMAIHFGGGGVSSVSIARAAVSGSVSIFAAASLLNLPVINGAGSLMHTVCTTTGPGRGEGVGCAFGCTGGAYNGVRRGLHIRGNDVSAGLGGGSGFGRARL